MPLTGTFIYCARSAYFTRHSVIDITNRIDGANRCVNTEPGTLGFIVVDLCDVLTGEPRDERVMLAVRYISSVTPKTYYD